MRRSTRTPSRGLLLAALPLLLSVACGGGEREPLNVLLISLDSTRRDLLGAYGREPARAPELSPSPALDELGREGVVMLDALASTSWTLPSHLSLLTGQPELVHAVDIDYLRMEGSHPMLAEVLREQGYRTAGFYSGPYLEPHYGFGRGFERYEACYGEELAAASAACDVARAAQVEARRNGDPGAFAEAARRIAEADNLASDVAHRDISSARVADAALAELERAAADERPFFLFAHFFDPHYDYVPPAPYDERYDPGYAGTLDGEDFYTNPRVSVPDPQSPGGRRCTASPRELEHVQALYEGELAWTDAQLARLLERLDELGLREDTLVVVSADHGDEFFEHGGLGHRNTLYEEVLRVPLILRLPGRLAAARVAGPVSNVDVMATVLELLDLPSPGRLASRSFLPLIEGREEPGERGVLGRLVLQKGRTIELQTAEGTYAVPCKQMEVSETWRQGPIKITRERSWPEVDHPAAARALAAQRRAEREAERLRWIDLEQHPGEAAGDHSSDFDADPRAAAALAAFRATYEELLALRRGARERAPGEARPAGLEGLGYVAEERPNSGADLADMFLLPPPGGR